MSELKRFNHGRLGNFIGASFDHDNGVGRAGHAQVQGALFHLWNSGVNDQFAVDPPHADGSHWSRPRHIGDRQCR